MIDTGGTPRATGSLAGIDIDPATERAYRILVRAGHSDSADVAGLLDVDPDAAQHVVDGLVAAGLAVLEHGAIEAGSPQLAVGGSLSERERSVADARAALDQLSDEYRRARDLERSAGIEIIRGQDEIRHWFGHVLGSAQTELRLFAKPPFQVTGVEVSEPEAEVATRGIRERLVIEWALLDEENAESSLIASLDRGQDIRMTPSLPAKLLIADDDLALVQLDSGGRHYSEHAVVRPSALLDCMMFVFESVWRGATQLREAPGQRIGPPKEAEDPVDREVLTLLLAGHTDATVAARLGVGLRTVQRRVRKLMDLAGTDSRVVLGWHARDRGWL
ncbi:MAG: hypothetical protein LBU78_03515 [Microbacterium sp.]|jgi:DNA-binding CsgD family transcriptional regulator|nr:hypothetical protein [Microbacterium sp.]